MPRETLFGAPQGTRHEALPGDRPDPFPAPVRKNGRGATVTDSRATDGLRIAGVLRAAPPPEVARSRPEAP
ncbi:hypothetical protein GCM10009564_44470 [Streptomyces thermogriseus]|uniref:Uncharacterized protein n=1 Tax=Streptomyces thermogriseus TaxID=75292 RepID=A0ABP4DPT6_9ACTN